MMSLIEYLAKQSEEMMPAMLSFLWQSSLLIGLGGAISLFLHKRNPRSRHALWFGVLIMVALLPLAMQATYYFSVPTADLPVLPTTWYEQELSGSTQQPAVQAELSVASTVKSQKTTRFYPFTLFLFIYGAGAGSLLMVICLGATRIYWWRRTGTILTDGIIVDMVNRYRRHFNIRRQVRVIEHSQMAVPCTTGIWRPVIFVPISYAGSLSADQASTVIGHECAHIKRRDVGTLTVGAILRSILWMHPLVWLVLRQITILAEQSADSLVLDTGTSPAVYASTLTDIVKKHAFRKQLSYSSVGFFDFRHMFLHRIRAILRYTGGDTMTRKGYALLAGTVLTAVIAVTAVPLTGQQASAKDSSDERMTINLVVIDAATKEPIEGLKIVAHQWKYVGPKGAPSQHVSEYADSSITNAEGEITLKNLRNTLVNLIFRDEPIGRKWTRPDISFNKSIFSGGKSIKADIFLPKLKRNRLVTLYIEQPAIIRGIVVDPDGNPVEGVTVDGFPARRKKSGGNSLTGDCRYRVMTDAHGRYEMKIPGDYKYGVRLVAHDGAWKEWRTWANGRSEVFDLKTGEVVEDVTIRLTRPCTIQGVVIDKLGNPRPNSQVEVKYPDGQYNSYYMPVTISDDKGHFTLRHVRAGKMFVMVPQNHVTTYHPTKCEWPEHYLEPVTLGEGDTVNDVVVLGLWPEEVSAVERNNFNKERSFFTMGRGFKSLW